MELVISVELYSLRKEVKAILLEGLEDHELVNLEFSHAEFESLHWLKEDEFELKGLMYDVVRTKVLSESIILICFPDKQETALNKRLENLRKLAWSSHIPSKKEQHKLIQFLKSLYHPSSKSQTSKVCIDKVSYPEYSSKLTAAFLSPGCPPPEDWF